MTWPRGRSTDALVRTTTGRGGRVIGVRPTTSGAGAMNILDWVLLGCALLYGLSGYQQGFLVGSASVVGLVGGGFAGIKVAPKLLDGFDPGLSISVAALVVVLACAFGGQALGAFVGHELRERVRWRPARVLDALSGAALSALAMLLIAWVLGVAVSGARLSGVNKEVRDSAILGTVDNVMPGGSDRLLSAFNSIVDASGFPRYLEPFAPEHIKDVRTPRTGVLDRAGVVRAQRSVVKVLGSAPSCGRTLEGSGFVYANGRVMTNAHVVAGVDEPVVRLNDTDYQAEVVYYDPEVDVAVLQVPDLQAPTLSFGSAVDTGDPVAVLGYPENGPYDAEPGRVRDDQRLRSPDIYGDGTVYRDTYSLYSVVRQGNSGGPVVTPRGRVVGVVFAASVIDSDTGYALTARQVADAASSGASSSDRVDTGR
ncbi:MAG: MarP family serine protease, partial [Nocardioidaceae bacterium]